MTAGADAVFFGGYYAEAGLLVEADAWRRRRGARSSSRDGVKDPGFIKAAGDGRRGHDHHLPVPAPEESQDVLDGYQEAFNAAPGDLRRRGLRRGQRPPPGHRDGQHRPRVDARVGQRLRRRRRHQAAQVRRQRVSSRTSRCGPTRSRTARSSPTRRSRPTDLADRPHQGRGRALLGQRDPGRVAPAAVLGDP